MPSYLRLPMRRAEPGTEERQGMAEEAVVTHGTEQQEATTQPTRREFLTRTGQTGFALLLAGLPRGWVGAVYASDAPETPNVRIGIIALTDCSSIVKIGRASCRERV